MSYPWRLVAVLFLAEYAIALGLWVILLDRLLDMRAVLLPLVLACPP